MAGQRQRHAALEERVAALEQAVKDLIDVMFETTQPPDQPADETAEVADQPPAEEATKPRGAARRANRS